LLRQVADGVLVHQSELLQNNTIVVPGHGSVGGADAVRARAELDRAYVLALRDGQAPDDPRIGPSATFGSEWLPGVAEWQRQQFARRGELDGTSG
jgi:hypothetical protein